MKCYVYTNEWHNAAEGEGSCTNRVFILRKDAITAMNDDVNDFERLYPNTVKQFNCVDKTETKVVYYSPKTYYYNHQLFMVEEVELEMSEDILISLDSWIRQDIKSIMMNDGIDPKDYPKLVNRFTDELIKNGELWCQYDEIMYDCIEEDREYKALKTKLKKGGN